MGLEYTPVGNTEEGLQWVNQWDYSYSLQMTFASGKELFEDKARLKDIHMFRSILSKNQSAADKKLSNIDFRDPTEKEAMDKTYKGAKNYC